MSATAIALWRGLIPIDWLASLGYKGIFFLSLVNGIAPVAGPSQIATFFVASKLNPLAVGLAAGIGGAIGELAGYAFGYSLRAAQSEAVDRKIQRIANWRFIRISRERSFAPLFILASIPNPFFDPASALAGSLRIGFTRYFVPVLLGKTVRHLAIAYAGYYAISGYVAAALREVLMMIDFDAVGFVAGVFGIALISWLVPTPFKFHLLRLRRPVYSDC
jgi:membrane protein YqaA with SNARE-associated domain